MEHWEFLLQKEGDRAWLPLESPNAEILEGQYQIVARSNLIDTKINIQISHLFNRDGAPEQRFEAHSQKTDSQGVAVVVPSTYLHPGLWKLSCAPSEALDQAEDIWRRSIHLQVLCHDQANASEDWEPDWQPSSEKSMVDSPVTIPDLAKQQILQDMGEEVHNQVLTPQKTKVQSPRLPSFTHQNSLLSFKVSKGQVFPPQLSKSSSSDGVRKPPELPAIPRPRLSSAEIEMFRSHLEGDPQEPTVAPVNQLLAETAFEALQLKERFRLVLSALAKQTMIGAPLESDASQLASSNQVDLGTSQTILTSSDRPQDDQVQVSTEADTPNQLQRQQDEVSPKITTEHLIPSNSHQPIAADPFDVSEIVPLPSLLLPEAELVMGQLITVYVSLPNPSTPMYVKLWIKDRQTRSLLDGPRWLVEFTLNHLGVLEASTQLMVPLGSLEISFEAIAVDMQTNRESHKATVNRLVMPLDLPPVDQANP